MAIKRIEKDDLVAKNVLDNLTQGAKESKSAVDLLEKSLKAVVQLTKATKSKVASTSPKDVKSVQELNQLADRSNKLAQNKIRIDKELKKEKERLQMLNTKIKKDLRDEITLEQKQVGTLEKLNIQNRKLREERKKLNLETKKGSQRLKEINGQLDKNNAKIKASSDAMKKQKLNIGNYSSAVGKLRGALAQLGLAFGVFSILRTSFNVVKDFGQAQANLASVLGVSTKEMTALTEQSQKLGATTTFTASQVAELQKEFAKLGFTQKEIENVTEATLLLAEATGTDLARSAEVTGSTIRAFGLDSTDTQRVVDVMAKSFSSSSLDMEKFAVAMRAVAPVAKTAGLNIEQTTALIGTLTDRGLDASTAGTSLRNVFLELSKQGITFGEAMKQINESSDKNATALDLFGKRGATTGVILSETADDVELLTTKLLASAGASEKMAETQRNTLGGSLKLLKSAFEGFILQQDKAGGASEKLKNIIEFLSRNLDKILSTLIFLGKQFLLFKATMLASKVAMSAYRIATNSTKVAVDALGVSTRKMDKAMKSTGIGLMVTLLIQLAYYLYEAVTAETELEKKERERLETAKELKKEQEEEQKRFDKSIATFQTQILILKKTNKGSKERARLINKINKTYGTTIKNLSDEAKFLNQVNIQADQYIQLQKTKFLQSRNEKEITKQLTLQVEAEEKIAKLTEELFSQRISDNETLGQIRSRLSLTSDELKKYETQLFNANKALKDLGETAIDLETNVTPLSGLDDFGGSGGDKDEDDKIKKKTKKLIKADLTVLDARLKAQNKIDKEREKFFEEQLERQQDLELDSLKVTFQKTGEVNLDKINRLLRQEADYYINKAEMQLISDIDNAKNQEEVILAQQRYNQKLIQIDQNLSENKIDIAKQFTKEIKKQEDERFEIQKASIDLATQYFNKRADERIDKINEEMEMAKKQSDYFRQLASEGNISAKESLAEQNKIIAEANAQKEREEKRKQRILLVSSVLQAYNSELEKGEDSGKAIMKALTSTTLITQFVNALPAFAEGTENTSLDGRGKNVDGKGGFHAILHQNERVMTAKQNKLIGDYSNNEVASIMEKHRLGKLMPDSQIMIGLGSHELVNKLMNVEEKLDQVTKAIQDKPIPNIELGEITQSYMVINKRVEGGKGTTTSKFKVQ